MEGVPWCHVVDDTAAAAGISYSQPGSRSGITHLGTSRQPLLIWPSWGTPAGPAHPTTGALPFGATWLARWRVGRPLRAPHDTADKLERAHPAGRIWAALRPILRGFESIWITKDLGFGLILSGAFRRCAGLVLNPKNPKTRGEPKNRGGRLPKTANQLSTRCPLLSCLLSPVWLLSAVSCCLLLVVHCPLSCSRCQLIAAVATCYDAPFGGLCLVSVSYLQQPVSSRYHYHFHYRFRYHRAC